MTLKEAVKILEQHNKWRRGDDIIPMLSPRDVGIAIDAVLAEVKKTLKTGKKV
jgi:nucleoid DNA-binding protein